MKAEIVTSTLIGFFSLFGLASSAATYTGQQLFQGVFFAVGPVAQLAPELYQQNPPTNQPAPDISQLVSNLTTQALVLNNSGYPEEAGKLLRMAQRISSIPTTTPAAMLTIEVQSNLMNQVALADPTFFDRFGTNMQSGNAVLVSAAVKEGSERLWTLVETMSDSEFASYLWFSQSTAVTITSTSVAVAVKMVNYIFVGGSFAVLTAGAEQYRFDDQISLLTARLSANGAQPVPTLSKWGMILLIITIPACGIYAIKIRLKNL